MLEQNIDSGAFVEREAPAAEPSVERMPFVPPSVEDLGGLNRLTQLGGSLGG
jgi:hypothetical protein